MRHHIGCGVQIVSIKIIVAGKALVSFYNIVDRISCPVWTKNNGVAIWNELALAYQIDPTQLRIDDKIFDIDKRDWFGDSALSIESKLNAIGGAPLPDDATVFDLVLLLASQEHKHS